MNAWTERGLWAGSLLIVVGASWTARGEQPSLGLVPGRSRPIVGTQPVVAMAPRIDVVIQGNLFRPDRAPAPPEIKILPRVEPPAPRVESRPRLILRGILGGPPWTALIEGFPGRQGATVVREGDLISGFTIETIRRESVVVTRPDTSWTLIVGKP